MCFFQQVSCWGPELIELEDQAKQAAEYLFFVVDNSETRSVASMIEVVYLIGCNRKLILSLIPPPKNGKMSSDTLSDKYVCVKKISKICLNFSELRELSRCHNYLVDFAQRHDVFVANTTEEAFDYLLARMGKVSESPLLCVCIGKKRTKVTFYGFFFEEFFLHISLIFFLYVLDGGESAKRAPKYQSSDENQRYCLVSPV